MDESKTRRRLDNKLKLGLVLNTIFTVIEFILGFFSGSLALISDAGHNLTDSFSILIAYFAQKIARRDANLDHSYGYGRATILAALLNGTILILLALYIFYESYLRLLNPKPVQGGIVALVAFIGIIVNGSIAYIFMSNKNDLNIKGAYLNMFFDTLASVGALLAGILILATKITIFDPIISMFIGILLIRASWNVVREAMHVLLEGVPEGIDIKKVKNEILNISKIKNVDDMHIWAISSHFAAMSCHIIIEDCSLGESIKIVKEVKENLNNKFNIQHATIETELIDCPPETLSD